MASKKKAKAQAVDEHEKDGTKAPGANAPAEGTRDEDHILIGTRTYGPTEERAVRRSNGEVSTVRHAPYDLDPVKGQWSRMEVRLLSIFRIPNVFLQFGKKLRSKQRLAGIY